MPISDPELWRRIEGQNLPFRAEHDAGADPPRDCARFEHNLRKLGDWTDDAAHRIACTYRQFLYLKALSGRPITPSTSIDQAWHLHLSFPEDYSAFCRAIGREIPHRTDLSHAETQRAYDFGRGLFAAEFDQPPPRDIWPAGDEIGHPQRLMLATLGLGMLCMFIVAMAAFVHWSLGFAVIPVAALVLYLNRRWGGTIPERMARCG